MKIIDEKFKSVKDLVRKTTPDDEKEFLEAYEGLSAERQIIKYLMGLRAAQNKSQSDIARSMGCSQSRVSKFEASRDDELRLGDLRGYLEALDFDLRLVFARSNLPIAAAIKLQWRGLLDMLKTLSDMSGDDIQMNKAVADIHVKLASEFLDAVIALAKKMDAMAPVESSRRTRIEVLDIELDIDMPDPTSEPSSNEASCQAGP